MILPSVDASFRDYHTIIILLVLADVLTGCEYPRVGHPSQEKDQDAIFLATGFKNPNLGPENPYRISDSWTRPKEEPGPDRPGSHGQEKDDFLGYWIG